eukprot:CAMPEP_0197184434 /NCGR_PEP_ID=MMETSP1423-20130617/9856_1 /TAXON_ID=476441 /ORGANISM="Pseudo-nitzschia heimii, Strain UNC1101" /LENGTH=408 /DNA_ID=CAMNT_0042635239 /DNA_START=141 /DNA_END=1367 /DNA_ORIENTATION=+
MAGRFVVYLLLTCSAALLYKSFQLESHRFESFIRNSISTTSRVLPEEDPATSEVVYIGNSEFFVPSLDYRIKGVSQYRNDGRGIFEAHVYCREFEKDLLWEWWKPTHHNQEGERHNFMRHKDNRSGTNRKTTKKRLLIGLSSGYDDRARLLERAVWSARVYGTLWSGERNNSNMDNTEVSVVTLQGTAFSPHGCKAPSAYSSIDKIRILFEAIDSNDRYDRLLLLDTDAMIYGMDTDLTLLGDGNNDFVVMGSPVLKEDGKREKDKPWAISSDITLWNLENPLTRVVALDWFEYAKNAIIRGSYQSDQKYLHKALKQYYSTNQDGVVKRNRDRNINILRLIEDGDQFGVQTTTNTGDEISKMNGKALNVNGEKIEAQLARMEETSLQICTQYPDACKDVGAPPRYETS